jgi:hypothetical protein
VGRRCGRVEGKRDRVECGLVPDVGHRDGQPPPFGLPTEGEEGAALALDGDYLVNEFEVRVLVKIYDQPPRGSLDNVSARSGAAVPLQLQAQLGLVEGTPWRHRKLAHAERPTVRPGAFGRPASSRE